MTPSTQESRTATVTPAPYRPADRALGTCTWSKFQVRWAAVPAAYAGSEIATRPRASRPLAHRPRLVIASPYDDLASRGGDSGLACGHGARPARGAPAAAGGACGRRRRQRPVLAARCALAPVRGGRADRGGAGGHAVLLGAARSGARPCRALPGCSRCCRSPSWSPSPGRCSTGCGTAGATCSPPRPVVAGC